LGPVTLFATLHLHCHVAVGCQPRINSYGLLVAFGTSRQRCLLPAFQSTTTSRSTTKFWSQMLANGQVAHRLGLLAAQSFSRYSQTLLQCDFSAAAASTAKSTYNVPEGHHNSDLSNTACHIGLGRRRDLTMRQDLRLWDGDKPLSLAEVFHVSGGWCGWCGWCGMVWDVGGSVQVPNQDVLSVV
jgi:hypothetical protein